MNTIELYQNIKAQVGAKWMADLNSESIAIETEKVDKQMVWQRIADFEPVAGWLQTLDVTGLLKDFDIGKVANDSKAVQNILCAELIDKNGHSLHIRQANRTERVLLKYRDGDEKFYFTESQQQIQSKKTRGTASYRLYWPVDDINRQAKLSRLISIKAKG